MKQAFIFVSLTFFSPIGFAENSAVPAAGHRMEPCDYWRYDSPTGSYTCSITGPRIIVADAQEVVDLQRTVRQLQAALEAVEKRVKALEGDE